MAPQQNLSNPEIIAALSRFLRVAESEYNVLLSSLIHNTHNHDPRCNLSTFQPPTLSAILPLSESATVRVSIGSHRQPLNEDKMSVLHKETIVDIPIPTKYILLFYHEGFLHSGGPGIGTCARMFSVFAPKNVKTTLQNRNYSGTYNHCPDTCTLCDVLHAKKKITGLLHFDENAFGQTLDNPFKSNLWNDGFCLIKVATDKDFQHFPHKLLKDFIEKSTFNSLNQEIDQVSGKRCVLDSGSELTTQSYLLKNLHPLVSHYIGKCYNSVLFYLHKTTSVRYESKGDTMLINKGEVGYQQLHMDEKSKCSCGNYNKKK